MPAIVDAVGGKLEIILGGGISKKYDEFKEYLETDVEVKVAEFRNNAGIVGAAMFASKEGI